MRNYCESCGYKFRYKYQKISPCCSVYAEKKFCVKTGLKLDGQYVWDGSEYVWVVP